MRCVLRSGDSSGNKMPDIEPWIALSTIPEIGHITFRKLLSVYGKPEAVFDAPVEELAGIEGVSERKARNIKGFSDWKLIKAQLRKLDDLGVSVVTCMDGGYPSMLKQTEGAPAILYIKGSIKDEDRFAIAVVGSRKPTHYGRFVTEKFSTELAESGFTIVSGMARGIDTVAHVSAIKSGNRTIAVLGSGIDIPYPPENRDLMKRAADSGCVVSEFSLGTKPLKDNFPARNRLISGLSLGVLVVEATANSGSLITAGYALEQNREVFAVPGNINSLNSSGTNDLIKKGAKLIQSSDDIIGELAPMLKGYVRTKEKAKIEMTVEEETLCGMLTGEPVHIDNITRGLAMPPSKALNLLLGLELKGVVRQADGKRFYLTQG